MKISHSAWIFFAALAISPITSAPVFADTLLLQRTQKEQNAAVPRRGSTMSSVEAQFGAPSKKLAAVGKPPISRWEYPAFIVYFEHSHVIDTVMRKASESEMGAKPVAQPKR
jgi:hypothetical protein